MAQPNTIKSTALQIRIGDGASPEVFAHPCLINTERGVQFQSQGNDVFVPDCDSPDDPAFREFVKTGISATVTGSGLLDTASLDDYLTWLKSDDAKNVRVYFGTTMYVEMPMKLSEMNVTGTPGEKATVELTLQSDGIISDLQP